MYVTISNEHKDHAFYEQNTETVSQLPPIRAACGKHVFREGDKVDRIYVVVSGAVRLTRLLEDGRRQIIAFGFPGDMVGFPSHGRHHTDCEALTTVQLEPYQFSSLENGTGDPVLHKAFVQAALREIAAMQDHFMMLGRKSASEKVASFLETMAQRLGEPVGNYTQIPLSMSRADIADFLGLTTETVSRTISLFRKSQVIALDGAHTVVVLRPDALHAIANRDRG